MTWGHLFLGPFFFQGANAWGLNFFRGSNRGASSLRGGFLLKAGAVFCVNHFLRAGGGGVICLLGAKFFGIVRGGPNFFQGAKGWGPIFFQESMRGTLFIRGKFLLKAGAVVAHRTTGGKGVCRVQKGRGQKKLMTPNYRETPYQ